MSLDGHEHGGRVLNGAAEAEPDAQRNAAGRLRRQIAQIERDQPESSAFEQQIRGAEELLEAISEAVRTRDQWARIAGLLLPDEGEAAA